MSIVEITSLITCSIVVLSSIQGLSNHYRIVKIEEQTNGINKHLIAVTGKASYARGLKKGTNARRLRKD